jgi:hypothetical protein
MVAVVLAGFQESCKDLGGDRAVAPPGSPDEALFQQITLLDPFTSYTLFPNVDSIASGTLNGSNAHQPLVRVSLNAIALNALQNGTLPAGSHFPDGSTVVKQIIQNGQTVLFAVIHKDNTSEFSANGWLWAEYSPDGTPAISVTRGGTGCVGCHSREQGPQHDFVRTFERQH